METCTIQKFYVVGSTRYKKVFQSRNGYQLIKLWYGNQLGGYTITSSLGGFSRDVTDYPPNEKSIKNQWLNSIFPEFKLPDVVGRNYKKIYEAVRDLKVGDSVDIVLE
ncbi:hypothetical protein ELBI_37 [Anabaena phage Elbi]|nr:hypothetical protein ELBI_37 [Anabaena phage Elbi]